MYFWLSKIFYFFFEKKEREKKEISLLISIIELIEFLNYMYSKLNLLFLFFCFEANKFVNNFIYILLLFLNSNKLKNFILFKLFQSS